jgi:hypothetical protein
MRAFQPAWTIPPACWAWEAWGSGAGALAAAARSTAAAALLVFVDVMKELPATMVLRPSTATPWPWWPTSWPATSAWAKALPSLALVAVGLVPVILLSRTCAAATDTAVPCNESRRWFALPSYSTVCGFLLCKTV